MKKTRCLFFNTEYQSQYVNKKQPRVEINRQKDCFAERIEESWQIDPLKASKITKLDEDAKNRARSLILDTLKSVYTVDFNQQVKKNHSKIAETEADIGSELLAYINNLFKNQHIEKVLAPPATAKRVFGYMRPKQFHNILSNYQDSYGRTGGVIMIGNSDLANTSKRREALRNKKLENNNNNDSREDPCSPEKLAEMHFT